MFTLFLADDHILIQQGLESLIEKTAQYQVIGTSHNGRDAVRKCLEIVPDIVLMDVMMPEMNGIEATRQILQKKPDMKIIGLSIHQEPHLVLQMLRAGARGYLLKRCAFDELDEAIKIVMDGNMYLCRHLSDINLSDSLNDESLLLLDRLTKREREIMQLLAEGFNTKQIALRCSVSIKTVETHRHHIMNKLGLANLADLTRFAFRHGVITL